MTETVNIAGKDYPIIGYSKGKSGTFPIGDIPMMSDYKWQLRALERRLEHPENYPDEDNELKIKQLREWLSTHSDKVK